MRPASTGRRLGTPWRGSGRAARRLSALALALAAAIAGWQPALAGVDFDENWANSIASRTATESGQEREQHRWSRAARDADEEDTARPRRATHARRKPAARRQAQQQPRQRVASLRQDVASAPLRPLSIIEWATPKETVLVPRQAIQPPKGMEGAKVLGPLLASLGRDFVASQPPPAPILSSDRVHWLATASIDCLAAPLRVVMADLVEAFGPITVRWTCRNKKVNARVGGAKRSYHLTGDAIDFNVPGNYRAILAFLKGNKLVGGLKHYGGGAFHIDTGPRRTW